MFVGHHPPVQTRHSISIFLNTFVYVNQTVPAFYTADKTANASRQAVFTGQLVKAEDENLGLVTYVFAELISPWRSRIDVSCSLGMLGKRLEFVCALASR